MVKILLSLEIFLSLILYVIPTENRCAHDWVSYKYVEQQNIWLDYATWSAQNGNRRFLDNPNDSNPPVDNNHNSKNGDCSSCAETGNIPGYCNFRTLYLLSTQFSADFQNDCYCNFDDGQSGDGGPVVGGEPGPSNQDLQDEIDDLRADVIALINFIKAELVEECNEQNVQDTQLNALLQQIPSSR